DEVRKDTERKYGQQGDGRYRHDDDRAEVGDLFTPLSSSLQLGRDDVRCASEFFTSHRRMAFDYACGDRAVLRAESLHDPAAPELVAVQSSAVVSREIDFDRLPDFGVCLFALPTP